MRLPRCVLIKYSRKIIVAALFLNIVGVKMG
jgi:hypothetical protein